MPKVFAAVLVLISLISLCFVIIQLAKDAPRTIIVPTDYPTIQAAVGNASAGDTVFVRNGIYYADENTSIVIDKPALSLIGEDPRNTVIYGLFGIHSSGAEPAIRVAAPDITILGFTITNCNTAIAVANYYAEPYPLGCKIVGNNITGNGEGIRSQRSDVFISGNNITKNSGGIMGSDTEDIIIYGNNITGNGEGINTGSSRNITISGNNIAGNARGLNLVWYGPYFVYGNNFTENEYGIRFAEGCNNAKVTENNIAQNSIGVELLNFPIGGDVAVSGVGNTVYDNNFADNSQQAVADTKLEFENFRTGSNGTDVVLWDNGALGNYWSDYPTKYPDAKDTDKSGIGNTPYVIDTNNIDHYPLISPKNGSATLHGPTLISSPSPSSTLSLNPTPSSTVPEFPTWIILPLFVTATTLLLAKKKKLS